jgi:hypothetical protein
VRLGDVIRIDCGLGLFSAGRTWDMGIILLCATFGIPLVWDGQVAEWHAGWTRSRLTNGGSVCVHQLLGFLCRVDEGKKRLASWEVLHMLEEGVRGRTKTEELGHVWYREVAK